MRQPSKYTGATMRQLKDEIARLENELSQAKVHHTMFMGSITGELHITPFSTESEIIERVRLVDGIARSKQK